MVGWQSHQSNCWQSGSITTSWSAVRSLNPADGWGSSERWYPEEAVSCVQ